MKKQIAAIALLSMFQLLLASGDLSAVPAFETDSEKYTERYRYITDLNGDGVEDLLLSGGLQTFGTSGGYFEVHIKRENEYESIGYIDAHPKAIRIEKLWNKTRIWVYLHGSASSGMIGFYDIESDQLSKFKGFEIYPTDGRKELSNKILDTIMTESILVERSTTKSDGTVTWNPWK